MAPAAVGSGGCVLCGETRGPVGGWRYAAGYTFQGRVHLQCIEIYEQLKPLLYDLHVANEPKPGDWDGWTKALQAIFTPLKKDGSRDMDSAHGRVWWHCMHNLGRLLDMMAATHAA